MRGARSEGSKTAKEMEVVSRRAAMRGASSARGTAMRRPVSGAGEEQWVIEYVDIDGVGWEAPGLYLLGNFLGVGGGKNAGDASVFE